MKKFFVCAFIIFFLMSGFRSNWFMALLMAVICSAGCYGLWLMYESSVKWKGFLVVGFGLVVSVWCIIEWLQTL
jgi:hypothetical protein